MSVLSTAKQLLIERAVKVYLDRRNEIDFEEYPSHFKTLGEIISQIDSHITFSSLIHYLEIGGFEVLGLFPSDNDLLEGFLQELVDEYR